MTPVKLNWPLIEVDATGMAFIEGTKIKVIEIALDRIAHHWDADEIQRQHPHLTLAQIHSALAYYYENQTVCDDLIEARRHEAETLREVLEDASTQQRLRKLARP
jgi:uncharacterized protein (DUF433 family)